MTALLEPELGEPDELTGAAEHERPAIATDQECVAGQLAFGPVEVNVIGRWFDRDVFARSMHKFPIKIRALVAFRHDQVATLRRNVASRHDEFGDVEASMLHPSSLRPTSARSRSVATLPAVSVLDLHRNLAWVVMAANLLAGIWALAAHRNERFQTKQMWWACYAAHGSIALQITIGVLAHTQAETEPWGEAPSIHMFYGFIALASVAIIAGYRQQLEEWRFLLYGFGSLFLMGLSIRSFFLLGPI